MRMNVKNPSRSFHLYAISAYAVSDEKYIAHAVAQTDTNAEFRRPTIGLNDLFANTFMLASRYVEGIRVMLADCISGVLRVALMNMTQNGAIEDSAKMMHSV
jgi:hypothetical protein